MLRLFVVLAVVGALFATAFASAAALNVNGGFVQSGQSAAVTCDTDGVSVAYKTMSVHGPSVFTGAEVTNISTACDGSAVLMYLLKGTPPGGEMAPSGSAMWKGTITGGVANVNTYYKSSTNTWVACDYCGAGPLIADIDSVNVIVKSALVTGE